MSDDGKRAVPHQLGSREAEVLSLIARGYSNQEIADEIGISVGTVKTHVLNCLRKLGATSRTHAVYVGLKQGIIEI